MTDGRLKALGTVASTLGVDYLFNMIDKKEAEELHFILRVCFVNANQFNQKREMEILKEQAKIFECIPSHKTISEIYEHEYK